VTHKRSDRPNIREAPLLAARQHGAIKASQLGLPRSTIADWVRAGRLYPKYRGVYAYGHPHLSREGEWMAGVLAGGDGAALADLCAAALMRITTWEPTEIEIVVPGHRRPQAGLRLRTCRNLDPRDITVVKGIPVTTVARVLVDLTEERDADDVAAVIHEAAYRGKFSLPATRAAMTRANGRHNLGVLEEALRLHLSGSAGTRSRLEKRFRRLVRGAGLPEPRINTIVNGFEVDAYWPGVCVEVDGLGHRRPRTQAEDRIRDAALSAAGYTLLRFTEDDVDFAPAKVLAALFEHVGGSFRKRLQ
jgi:very-short-patch-repair endonuclease